ncbi:hypothetical protein QVD17_15189 [Tagetes erecta]|uniref:PHD finger protein ALFIN-LIKE n=1 Tax=Tagetes erecta TaxID=13708 RepID=A0AAD8KNS8_TARER|nr:hypothetical protein QVD17_15189 [Tagetes erecta]
MEEKAINRPSTQPYMTVEEIYNEYCGRRSGLIRALTQDVDILYELCDPQRPGDKKLCLFGYPDCSWNVRPPFGKVPPKIPEPLIGINVIRNEKDRKDWITMVALHSDSWLMAVTFYYAIWSPLDKDQRALLVSLIHSDTNVYEAVIAWNEPAKDNTTEASGSKSRSTVKKLYYGRKITSIDIFLSDK